MLFALIFGTGAVIETGMGAMKTRVKSSNARQIYSSGFGIFKVAIEELSKECKSEARPKPIAEILKIERTDG